MSKNQHKEKLLLLLHIFQRESDENHPLSVPKLLDKLQANGILAERKSVYADVEILRKQGYDIVLQRGRGYYLGERNFQLAELKLLVDAVQSSRFITVKKSHELIHKLEQQTSAYGAQTLQRQVFVAGRVKSMNESVYYNIDAIHNAINEKRQITFRYFDYNICGRKVLRHNGAIYQMSPYALLCSDENYYLTAYDGKAQEIKHFRVDKMLDIQMTEEKRLGREVFNEFDTAVYDKKMFGMFGGTEERVKLLCDNELANVILDRFGRDVNLIPKGEKQFTVNVDVAVSRQFVFWVMGLGDGAKIVAPESVVSLVQAEIERLQLQYKKE